MRLSLVIVVRSTQLRILCMLGTSPTSAHQCHRTKYPYGGYSFNNGTKLGLVTHIYLYHCRRIVNSDLFSSVQSDNGDIAEIHHFRQSRKILGSTYLRCGLTYPIATSFVTTVNPSDGILPHVPLLIRGELSFCPKDPLYERPLKI